MAKLRFQKGPSAPPLADGVISDEDVAASRGDSRPSDATGDTGELTTEPLNVDEITGRAASTDDDLTALFRNRSDAHLADGFRGGSDDEDAPSPPESDLPNVDEH